MYTTRIFNLCSRFILFVFALIFRFHLMFLVSSQIPMTLVSQDAFISASQTFPNRKLAFGLLGLVVFSAWHSFSRCFYFCTSWRTFKSTSCKVDGTILDSTVDFLLDPSIFHGFCFQSFHLGCFLGWIWVNVDMERILSHKIRGKSEREKGVNFSD